MRDATTEELIGMFKHFDTRASHQEILLIPISLAAFPAVAATWDDLSATMVFLVSIASQLTYLFFLLSARRFTQFQNNIYHILRTKHLDDWDQIVSDPEGRIGIRQLRAIGLILVSGLWMVLVLQKTAYSFSAMQACGYAIWLLSCLAITASQFRAAPKTRLTPIF